MLTEMMENLDIKKIIEALHSLERKVLPILGKYNSFEDIVKQTGLQEVEVMRALQWLQNKQIITINEEIKEFVSLDNNGKIYVKKGLPERRFLEAIATKSKTTEEIKKEKELSDEELSICLGALRKKAAIEMKKEGFALSVFLTGNGKNILKKEMLEEHFLKKKFPMYVKEFQPEELFSLNELKKRKEIIKIEIKKLKTVELTDLGKKIIKEGIKEGDIIDSLTSKMLKEGSWKGKTFRRYDVKINVPASYPGKRHFVNQSIEYIKRIWLDLGFKEMQGNLIQTAFWDLDALFVPQDHPAREMQDTFYLKNKGKLPKWYEKIKEAHENGADTGSKGWGYKWSKEEAEKVLLRTHTTVLSAQTIKALKETELPAKFFSVGSVFRNETPSWKHLFEFHQVEGMVVDPDANFKHLKGYLKEFYTKLGYKDIRMRPAHFPYTEPSVEVDVMHPIRNEWIELGGAGIFRPEVVKSLLGKEVPVLAWGQGLERGITEYYSIKDLRDIYKNDIKQLRGTKLWIK